MIEAWEFWHNSFSGVRILTTGVRSFLAGVYQLWFYGSCTVVNCGVSVSISEVWHRGQEIEVLVALQRMSNAYVHNSCGRDCRGGVEVARGCRGSSTIAAGGRRVLGH